MMTLRQAALDSVGIVQLRDYIGAADIGSGKLEVLLLPGWPSSRAIVFPSRRGLLPAVRRFIDFLAVEMSEA